MICMKKAIFVCGASAEKIEAKPIFFSLYIHIYLSHGLKMLLTDEIKIMCMLHLSEEEEIHIEIRQFLASLIWISAFWKLMYHSSKGCYVSVINCFLCLTKQE